MAGRASSHAWVSATLAVAACCVAPAAPAHASEWSRSLGTDDQTIASVAVRAPGDQVVVAGLTSDLTIPERTAWLSRLDADGSHLGASRLAEDAASLHVHELADGGALLGIGVERDAPGTQDLLAVRLDLDGGISWQVLFDAPSSLTLAGFVELADGSIVLLGDERDSATSAGDAWLARVDARGVVLWQRRLGGAGADVLGRGVVLPGGVVALVGTTDSFGTEGRDVWLVELDADTPAIRSQRRFVGSGSDVGTGLHLLPSGRVLLSAWTDTWGDPDVLVVELDDTLTPAWQRVFGASGDEFGGLLVRPSGRVLLVGSTTSVGASRDTADAWLVELDGAGRPIAQRSYGAAEHDIATWRELPDGNLLVACQSTVLPDPRDPASRPRTETWLASIDDGGWIEWQGVDASADLVTGAAEVRGDALFVSVAPWPLEWLGADADARITRVEDLSRRPPCFQATTRARGTSTAFHLDASLPLLATGASLADAAHPIERPGPPPSFPLEVTPSCDTTSASRIALTRTVIEEVPDGVVDPGERVDIFLGVRSLGGVVTGLHVEERYREAFMLPWTHDGGAVSGRGTLTWGPLIVTPDAGVSLWWQARADCTGQLDAGLIEAALATASAGPDVATDAWHAEAAPPRLAAIASQSVIDSDGDGRLAPGDIVASELRVDVRRRPARELVIEHRIDADLDRAGATFSIPPDSDDGDGRLTWVIAGVGDAAAEDWSVEVLAPVADGTSPRADRLVETTFRTKWSAASDCELPYFDAVARAANVARVADVVLLRHGDTSCLATALRDRLPFRDGPGLRVSVPGTTSVLASSPLRVAGDGAFGGASCSDRTGGALVHYQLAADAVIRVRRADADVVIEWAAAGGECLGPWQALPIDDPDVEDFEYATGLGRALAMSGDTLVAGAYQDGPYYAFPGAAYVLERDGSEWTQRARLAASDGDRLEHFGASAAIDGDTIVIGAMAADAGTLEAAGAVYVFEREGDAWIERQKLPVPRPPEGTWTRYASSVAVSGDRLAVGWPRALDPRGVEAGSVVLYARIGGVWTPEQEVFAPAGPTWGDFGQAVALDGDTLLVGAPGGSGYFPGFAHVFTHGAAGWEHVQELPGPDPEAQFGRDVALQGDRLAVGAPDGIGIDTGSGRGKVHLFERVGATWSEVAVVNGDGADDHFGASLSLEGDRLVVGAMRAGNDDVGLVHVFEREGAAWREREPLQQPYPDAGDVFGEDVVLHDGVVVVSSDEHHSTSFSRHAVLHAFGCGP